MPLTWPTARHIILSPHLDDGVLSCGGMIADWSRRGERVAILTVCAGSPPDPLPDSPIIRELHDRWARSAPPGAVFGDAAAMRRAEDLRAALALGESVEAVHLPYLDCIYRTRAGNGEPLYPTEETLNAELQADDPLLADLRDAAPLPDGSTLYVPLTIGRHVDHQAVRRAAEGWQLPSEQLVYYEDYPYAGREGAIEAATQGQEWVSRAVPLSDEALTAKIEAIAAYESQISSFWPDLAAMEAAVRGFAVLRGGERLWVRNARTARR